MLRLMVVWCMAVCAVCAADRETSNTLTAEEKHDGWVLLFDGNSMNGWDDPRLKSPPGDAWTIEDGCLKANRRPHITEDLFTSDTFGDFELSLEWRISPGGNSGVKYRIQDHRFVPRHELGMPSETFEQSVERAFLHPVTQRPARGQDYVIGFEYSPTTPKTAMPKETGSTPPVRCMTWWRRQEKPPGRWASSTRCGSCCAEITSSIG